MAARTDTNIEDSCADLPLTRLEPVPRLFQPIRDSSVPWLCCSTALVQDNRVTDSCKGPLVQHQKNPERNSGRVAEVFQPSPGAP